MQEVKLDGASSLKHECACADSDIQCRLRCTVQTQMYSVDSDINACVAQTSIFKKWMFVLHEDASCMH